MFGGVTQKGGSGYVRLLFDGVSEVVAVEESGSGQTTSSRQYSLMRSNRYFCHSRESPGGVMEGGLSAEDGDHTPRSKTRCSCTATTLYRSRQQ